MQPEASAAEAGEMVRELAGRIGPRLAGSVSERRAAEWLAERLQAAGFAVGIEQFRSMESFVHPYGAACLAGVAALALAWWVPGAAAVLGVLLALALILETLNIPILSRPLADAVKSRNVVAVLEATRQRQLRVILTAHIDSALKSSIRRPRVVRALLMLMIVAEIGIAASALGAHLTSHRIALALGLPFAAYLLACLLIMAHQFWCGGATPGAADNASGVAALALAAKEIEPLEYVEVWAVGTGAEEAGLVGMIRLLDQHRFRRDSTLFINLDNVGQGPLAAITAEGMLLRWEADRELVQLAQEAARELGVALQEREFRDMSTDACAALARGYRAMTLMGSLDHWHQPSDLPEHVDANTIATAAAVTAALVRHLNHQASPEP